MWRGDVASAVASVAAAACDPAMSGCFSVPGLEAPASETLASNNVCHRPALIEQGILGLTSKGGGIEMDVDGNCPFRGQSRFPCLFPMATGSLNGIGAWAGQCDWSILLVLAAYKGRLRDTLPGETGEEDHYRCCR
jgi:hypothetical protein